MIHIRQCCVCRKARRVNLDIMEKNICYECEKALVTSSAGDQSYGQYIDAIKNILYNCAK